MLTSYQTTSWRISSARPKVKITKCTPLSRSVDRPTISAITAPMRGGDQQHQRPGQRLAEHRHGIGADAEEGRGRQRDVARRAGEHAPGGRQHGELQQADREREIIGVDEQRHERRARQGRAPPRDHRCDCDRCHRCALPNRPAGLTSSTPRNSAKFTASVRPGSTRSRPAPR